MESRTGEAMLDTHRIDRNTRRPDFKPIRLGSELAGRHADDDHAGSGNLPVYKPFVSHLYRRERQARNRKGMPLTSSHSGKNDFTTFAGYEMAYSLCSRVGRKAPYHTLLPMEGA